MSSDTVGVIIPMFNAARTIEETLRSACAQTHRDLDIVVVDDGSTDASPAIVQRFPDPRVRLLHQANAGVAAARNNGARATFAPYLAFLDADDVWHPAKVGRQLALLADTPDALVWCWYDEIDDEGIVSASPELRSSATLADLCRWNIVGNGSSMLVSRRAFDDSGRFDTTLRERDAQGCEDYAFALSIAERFPIRIVAERLMGYRVSNNNMSANTRKMWRSLNLVIDDFGARHPEFAPDLQAHRGLATVCYYYRALQVRDYAAAWHFLRQSMRDCAMQPKMRRNLIRSWLRHRLEDLRGRQVRPAVE